MSKKESSGSQVIARAASLLSALEHAAVGLTLNELVQASGLPRTTVNRLVQSMVQHELLSAQDKRFKPGPAITRLAATAHHDVTSRVEPLLEKLAKRTGETVDFCVLRSAHMVSVKQQLSQHELRVASPLGTAFPAHTCAHGKAVLATLSDESIADILGETPELRTVNTLTSLPRILRAMAEIRQQQYAIDYQEHGEGVCGIGVALSLPVNERYGMALAAPTARFERDRDSLKGALLQCKAEIEALFSDKTAG